MNILFIFPNIDIPGYKPIGISSLIAVAKKLDHKVRLFDTSFYNVKELSSNMVFLNSKQAGEEVLNFIPVDLSKYGIEKKDVDLKLVFSSVLSEFKPDLVALSIFSQEYALGMFLMKIVKEVDKNILTICGGIHCYADPEEVINNESVDLVCVGEGEKVLENLLKSLEQKVDYTNIRGLWSKSDGKIIKNPPGDYVHLNELPFLDFDEYDNRQFIRAFNGKVYRSVDICLTRGCFERCIYCLHNKIYETYNSCDIRKYDIDRFIAELEYLKERHEINFIRFQDSSFLNVDETYLAEFSRKYKDKIGLPFVIDSTPQSVTYNKIKYLKDMNCQSISIGIETGNEQHRLKYLNKKATNKQIINAFDIVHKFNIRTVGFVLLSFPFETRENIFETIRLIREARVSAPNLGFVYPFKGTKLRELVINQGLFDKDTEINNSPQYSRDYPAIKNSNISEEEYRGIYRTFLFYCKFPEKYYNDIRIAESFDLKGNTMYKKLKDLYFEKNLFNNYLEESCILN